MSPYPYPLRPPFFIPLSFLSFPSFSNSENMWLFLFIAFSAFFVLHLQKLLHTLFYHGVGVFSTAKPEPKGYFIKIALHKIIG